MKQTIFAFLSASILLLAGPLEASASSVALMAGVPAPSAASSYSPMGTKWLVWALSQAASSNPFLDNTGTECADPQAGPTWFPAGFFGTSVCVARSVPARTALFFPPSNYFDAERMCADRTPSGARRTVAQANVQSGPADLTVTFDGTPVGPAAVQRPGIHTSDPWRGFPVGSRELWKFRLTTRR